MTLRKVFFGTIVLSLMPWFLAGFNNTLAGSAGKGTQAWPLPPDLYRLKTVVIDPGHGGHDPGCSGANSKEKHLALAIGQQLARYLRQQHPDLEVILTRDRDVFVPLHERAQIANRHGADLFISIHCNFFPNRESIRGSETYVMGLHTAEHNLEVAKRENAVILLEDDYEANYDFDPHSPEGHIMLSMFQNVYLEQSILFAEQVERHIEQVNQRPSRGVKQAGFVVLKETAMPSVLVETGFLSNRAEERYLRSAEGQQQVARAIGDAFAAYRLQLEGPAQLVAGTNDRPDPRADRITYCVQLAASPTPIDTRGARWAGLRFPVEAVREGGLYRYQARNFLDLKDAEAAKTYFRGQGFADAFVVAYRNGERVPLSRAR